MKAPRHPDKLSEALWSANEPAEFEALVFQDLRKGVLDIGYQEVASLTVKAAANNGWTVELVDAAIKRNPRNKLLKEFALLDPLNELLSKPSNKSTAAGGEVERALSALIQVINSSDSTMTSQMSLTDINSNLVDLYKEYEALVASTISAK